MDDHVSVLVDGELNDTAARFCLDRVSKDRKLRREWAIFLLIGDQLRGEAVVLTTDFTQRFCERLAAEPTILAPRAVPARFPLSVAASLVGVAVVAWAVLAINPQQAPDLAVAPKFMSTEMQLARQSIPEGTRDYLIAHQGVSPSGALQGLGSYARTVSDTYQGSGIQEK